MQLQYETWSQICDNLNKSGKIIQKSKLGLQGNHMSDGTIKPLFSLLYSRILRVVALNLIENCIGPLGAIDIARALKSNCHLKHLFLKFNKLGSKGAKYISRSLYYNNALKILDIGRNNIRDDGAKAIAHMLTHNKSLIEIDMSFNCIFEESSPQIAQALKKNTTLLKLGTH